MKYLVMSDTHGSIAEAKAVYGNHKNVNGIIHLGDYEKDALRLEHELGIPVISVKGNLDGSHSYDDYLILNTEFGKLYLTHGHMEGVKYDPNNLLYKATSLGCKAALFGHTHMPLYQDFGGVYLLNPGSIPYPRGGKLGSYAIIETTESSFSATILYWNQAKKEGPSPQSGFLRRVFNDSDGQ